MPLLSTNQEFDLAAMYQNEEAEGQRVKHIIRLPTYSIEPQYTVLQSLTSAARKNGAECTARAEIGSFYLKWLCFKLPSGLKQT